MDWKAITDLLTQIGAMAGFVAFVFKAWEFYRDRRPALSISKYLTSDPERGSTILVMNSSKVPARIHNYQLQGVPKTWLSRWWPRFGTSWEHVEFDLEDQHADIVVPAYGHKALSFDGPDHFDWSTRRTTDLYLRLWIVGRRRPLHFLIAKAGG